MRQSSIPETARQSVVEKHPNGTKKKAFWYLAGKKVGQRLWDERGSLFYECGMKNGLDHGLCRHFDNGRVRWEVPVFRGKPHGLSCQYDDNGRLIATNRYVHGTGVDLWYQNDGELTEERHI